MKKLVDNFRPDTPYDIKEIFKKCVLCKINRRASFETVI